MPDSARIAFERRVLSLFDAMLDQPPATHATWLAQESGHDAALIAAVQAMVTADAAAGVLPTVPPSALSQPSAEDVPLARIGNYRIVEEIGRGGMGIVYLAERDDGLFDHRVAIKFIRHAVSSEAARAQFETERQVLARLRHPHIAQMLDGGITEDGAPYIVMELIGGTTITEHAVGHDLPLMSRLALFQEAADAIEHAHRNLIAHADIKPSNVVVEPGFGVKLLDFGVARLLDDAQRRHHGGYTPGFASPERIAGLPPTIGDDVYASGALLRALIDGVAGVDGTLVAIIDKATAAAPDRRYGTVGELVADLRRWQQHRPVLARPVGRVGRGKLAWRRNRLAISLGAFVSLILLGTLTVTTILWLRAEHARDAAETRYAETRAMANYMLADVDPALARLPGTLPLRRRLVSKGRAYLQKLASGGPAGPALDQEVAAGYLRLAQIYGLDVSGGLGDLPAARESLRSARALIRAARAQDPADPLLLRLTAQADLVAASEAYVAPENAALDAALADAEAAQALFSRYLRRTPGDIDAALGLWRAQVMPARIYEYRGRMDVVQRSVEPTLSKRSMAVRTQQQLAERDFILNGAYLVLAESYEMSDPRRSYVYYDLLARHVAEMQLNGRSDLKNDYIRSTALAGMGKMDIALDRPAAAVRDYDGAIAEADRLLAAGPNQDIAFQKALVEVRLAIALATTGAIERGRALVAREIAWFSAEDAKAGRRANDDRQLAIAYDARSVIEQQGGDRDRACAAARTAWAQWTTVDRAGRLMPLDRVAGGSVERARIAVRRFCRGPTSA